MDWEKNMVQFEKVSRFKDVELPMPKRGTVSSAGYDFVVAEDVVVPPYDFFHGKIQEEVFSKKKDLDYYGFTDPLSLDDIAKLTKELKSKITLVSTGMKCYLEPNQYLELSVRSSTPLKHWLIMGNSVGIIDSDYCDNPDNEGEIFFQLINFSPFAIQLKRGDKIGQGIIKTYGVIDDDKASGKRHGGFGSTGT